MSVHVGSLKEDKLTKELEKIVEKSLPQSFRGFHLERVSLVHHPRADGWSYKDGIKNLTEIGKITKRNITALIGMQSQTKDSYKVDSCTSQNGIFLFDPSQGTIKYQNYATIILYRKPYLGKPNVKCAAAFAYSE